MFTGVVVENFSYVFQLTGEMSITREEMRAFKKVWAEFDPDRTGYISRKSLVPFFSVCSSSRNPSGHYSQIRASETEGRIRDTFIYRRI